jgi:hypothetical protein
MKVRHGFVSNSSSSSFVCDITGNTESGYDASPRDVGMAQCSNGHTFMEDFLLKVKDFTLEKYVGIFVTENNKSKYRDTLDVEIVAKFLVEQNDGPVEDYDTFVELINAHYDEEYDSYEVPACRCPICMMEEVSTDMLFAYLLKKAKKTRKEITTELKEKFNGDNSAFEAYTKGK